MSSFLRRPLLPAALALLAAAAPLAAARTGQVPASASPADSARVYTDEQAARGQAVFAQRCGECHESKDVSGANFRTKWGGRPVYALFEQIRTTMPDGNPGSLPREDYLVAVAYILKLNGMPSGSSPLVADSAALSAITLDIAPPSR